MQIDFGRSYFESWFGFIVWVISWICYGDFLIEFDSNEDLKFLLTWLCMWSWIKKGASVPHKKYKYRDYSY